MNNNNLHKVYLIGFCLILFLPLLTIPPYFIPCSWGSSIVFRIILSVLIFLFICQVLKGTKFLKIRDLVPLNRKNRIFWPFWLLVALLAIYLLATIFSLDPRFSFWGSPYRSGGSLNFSFLIFFSILAFLVFQKKDWKKIWFFAFIAGILVCAIAFIQKFELFKTVFIPSEWQPYSTLGGPTFLALYLLLFSFLPLSFGIDKIHPVKSDKVGVPLKAGQFNRVKKSLFYFFCAGLFTITTIIVAGRAAILGFAAGFLFFLFFYPVRSKTPQASSGLASAGRTSNGVYPAKSYAKKLVWLKIFTLIIFAGAIFGVYWLNNQPKFRQSLEEIKILSTAMKRIFPAEGAFSFRKIIIENARFSAWKVGWEAIKERPILGYGPENFSIGFDKYYDPALPGLKNEGAAWFDKAHNFIFDIGVTAGIPALIIYLSLFGVLFWQLQKVKNQHPIIAHGIQATFIGYLVANLFGFDIFSTYLILFLIIGYSLHLISSGAAEITQNTTLKNAEQFSEKNLLFKKISIGILFAGLIIFIWSHNLKPLKINKELNWADYYSNTKRCQKSFENMEEILANHSIIDSYVRLKYINVIGVCIRDITPQEKVILSQKAIELLKEAVELMPYYTRSWLFLGGYTTTILNNAPNLDPAVIKNLKEEAYSYSEKAHQLKPKSQMILKELIKADLSLGKYEKAKEEAQECINIKPSVEDCWWLMGLANIYLGENSQAKENMEKAVNLGFSLDSEAKLLPLMEVYAAVKNYQELIEVYKQLLMRNNLPQYHASLATCYKEVGDYENARKEAIAVVQLMPEAEAEVEEFLKTIPLK